MKILKATRNIIGSMLFNVFFWVYFMMIVLILLPLYHCINYKTMRIIAYKSVSKGMYFMLRIFLGIKYEITGREMITGQCIIGSNHQSMWETLAIPDILPNTRDISVVVKQELQDTPLFGQHMRKLRNIALNRSKPMSALKTLLALGKEAKNAGDSILIFTTGTRSKVSDENNHKVGVYALYKNLGLPVVPCYLDSGKCWGKNAFLKKSGTIHVSFKEPIQPGLSREEFDAKMRESFTEL